MKKIIFEKIKFLNICKKEFDNIIIKNGLFLFPSAPGLASIKDEVKYYNSLIKADFVFPDSGFFVLLLKFLKNIKVNRFSGYKFIKLFLIYLKKKSNEKIFLIDPNLSFSKNNKILLKKIGLKEKKIHNYVAPNYNPKNINDLKLLEKLSLIKPKTILINLGGGTQEVLGLYLKHKLNFKTKIICTGAAISFFTGDQAPINDFFDRYYLGWLVRIIYNPFSFYKRYIYALKLISIVIHGKVKIS